MTQKFLYLAAFCLPFLVFSQEPITDKGIQWTTGLSWNQVKAKAKKESKFIFVDAYATWCKPCKEMDEKVYALDSVGEYVNKEFISVKVQMDQTKNDDAFVKNWYKTAGYMRKEFNLNAYPTLLFFMPSGELAIKEVGYKDANAFMAAAKNSQDPSKQYYVLLKNYKKGKLDDAATRSLINTAKSLDDTINYRELRSSYFKYLYALPKEKLFTKENIEFVASTISRRDQVVFDMFYPDGKEVNRVMQNQGYSKKVVDDIIMKEKLAPVLNAGVESKLEPDWAALYNSIARDYKGDYAARNVLEGKIQWYGRVQPDVMKFARALNEKMEKFGSDTTSRSADGLLNNLANFIFEGLGTSASPVKEELTELTRVSNWMEGVMRRGATATGFRLKQWPMYIDTYANLLHKIGRTTDGIKWEEFAIDQCGKTGDSGNNIEEYKERLDKMRKNEPTWPIAK